MEDDWYKKSGKLGEVAKLKQAGDEMKEAAGDLRRDDPREAQPHGEIAEEFWVVRFWNWSRKWPHLLEIWSIN